ncbi:MAG: acyl carrier protein [Schwartzia succinivorans]|jgi:acyl carrier protein|uniref:acyl carrier protein n=1 Tax=Schwartzia succinivorans TaxID=55507 RepID=UPI0023522C19|nr:acyl carrier protein [Schwartzia succinivorans]MBE6097707.1 acyl carrier protein [Schwartzia succinivorans]
MDELLKKIEQLLKESNEDIPSDYTVDLLEGGYIDSFDIVNLVSSLEEKFDIDINPEDIIPENFCSVSSIGNLVKKNQN